MFKSEFKKFVVFFVLFILTGNVSFADGDVVLPQQYLNNFYNSRTKYEIPSVTMQTSGYINQLQSYNQGFKSMDTYMMLNKNERAELRNAGKELSETDDNSVLPPTRLLDESRELWARPYAVIENIQFKNGPNVKNITYGSYFGVDTEMVEFGDGYSGNVGLFAGYNGSHQNYDNVGVYMNGGTLGISGSIYKGNAFAGVTTSAGAHTGKADSGVSDYDVVVLSSGVAGKAGYNFEFMDGSFIVQPSFEISYTYVDSFDYTAYNGFKVSPDCLNAIQLEPNIKFIWNMKNNFQSYASVSADWNLLDATRVDIASYQLPKISVKPYVKYGVGIRKKWNDRFSFSEQTYIYNGGRNGVGFDVDMKMAIGKKR